MINAETFTPVKNRFLDWLMENNTGGNVSDVALDCLNRAQAELWMYRPWANLVTTQSLTLTDKAASLPSDFGRVIRVYHDSNDDNLPDWYYYNRSTRSDDGYFIRSAFDKDTGHSWTITFYYDPSYTPILEYQKVLADFAGSGTEYTFFPAELLLATAMKIRVIEGHMMGGEYDALVSRQMALLMDYEHSHQYVNVDVRMEQNDDDGVPILTEDYDLRTGSGGIMSNFDNSYDLR